MFDILHTAITSMKCRSVLRSVLAYSVVFSIMFGIATLLMSSPLAMKVYGALGLVGAIIAFGVCVIVLGAVLVVGILHLVKYLRRVYRKDGTKGLLAEGGFAGVAVAPFASVLIGWWGCVRLGIHVPLLVLEILIVGSLVATPVLMSMVRVHARE